MKVKEVITQHIYEYLAFDQELRVFAGYKNGYPYWSNDINEGKEINDTTHFYTLKSWFPNKQIELIKL
jgi:hypothetical protein